MRRFLPSWMRSIRFRLALTYSILVFGLAGIVIGGVNIALSRSLSDYPVSQRSEFRTYRLADGTLVTVEQTVLGRFVTLEQLANERALANLRKFSLLALVGMFPASVVIGWLVADRALSPIGEIADVARDIQATDLSRRIDLDTPEDELKVLADTFDEMLDRIEAGVEAQRRFIQDTSHELRNPLAVMATNLDVVLADDDANLETWRRTGEIVRRTVDRTARTVDDLLTFARREVPESRRSKVDLGELAGVVLDEFSGPIESRQLHVDRVPGSARLDADREAIKRAFSNLVGNAVRLSRPGTTLRYGAGERDGWAWLGIDDQGPGIDPGDHELIFRRGWSHDRGSVGGEERSGLGLAIARQVAESHGGVLTLSSVAGAGASFVLWLPLRADAARDTVTADGLHPIVDPLS